MLIEWLVAAYRAWPLRPHCGNGRHTLPCRMAGPLIQRGPGFPPKPGRSCR